MIRVLLFLFVIEVAFPVVLYLIRDRVIFLPSQRPGPEEGLSYLRGAAEVRLIRIRRPDGRLLSAYDARPTGIEEPGVPVVLFFHGNAGNIAYRAALLEELVLGTGARIVLFDYSGYGGNEGSPSEEEVLRDGLAAYDHVAGSGVPPARIVLYGESLGGAVALAVAAERPCAGVVAQSSFSTLSSLSLRIYPWMPLSALLVRGSLRSVDRVSEIGGRVPLLVVHGTKDEIIPFAEGERLHRAAPAGTEFLPVEGAGHNDFFSVAGRDYLRLLGRRFCSWVAQGIRGAP